MRRLSCKRAGERSLRLGSSQLLQRPGLDRPLQESKSKKKKRKKGLGSVERQDDLVKKRRGAALEIQRSGSRPGLQIGNRLFKRANHAQRRETELKIQRGGPLYVPPEGAEGPGREPPKSASANSDVTPVARTKGRHQNARRHRSRSYRTPPFPRFLAMRARPDTGPAAFFPRSATRPLSRCFRP